MNRSIAALAALLAGLGLIARPAFSQEERLSVVVEYIAGANI